MSLRIPLLLLIQLSLIGFVICTQNSKHSRQLQRFPQQQWPVLWTRNVYYNGHPPYEITNDNSKIPNSANHFYHNPLQRTNNYQNKPNNAANSHHSKSVSLTADSETILDIVKRMESIQDDDQHDRQLAWAIARNIIKNRSPQNRELFDAIDFNRDVGSTTKDFNFDFTANLPYYPASYYERQGLTNSPIITLLTLLSLPLRIAQQLAINIINCNSGVLSQLIRNCTQSTYSGVSNATATEVTTIITTEDPITTIPTTIPPTTAAPTTVPQTTVVPTAAPTTAVPTAAPPTAAPPTVPPPTAAPPTAAPPTAAPPTAAPTTAVPTAAPPTAAPLTAAPPTTAPTTAAATTVAG